jgi:uncharacterized cupin superfamily protein
VTLTSIDPQPGQRFQTLRRELGVGSFGLNLIVLEPRQRGRIHAHEEQEEVYLVLEGELTLLTSAGDEHRLAPWQLARVAPSVRRQLVNRGPARLVLLAIGGSGGHAGRDGLAWESFEEQGAGRPPQQVPLPDDLNDA